MKFLLRFQSNIQTFLIFFLIKKTLILPEQIELNEHDIKLENNKQLSYKRIYSLGLVKLKILKMYIKTYLKIELI